MHSPVRSRNAPAAPLASHSTHGSPRTPHRYTHQRTPSSLAADSFQDVDIADSIVRPPPSAVTSRSPTAYDPNAPSPLQDYPSSARSSHQRTLSTLIDNCQPFLNRATTTIQQHTLAAASFRPPSPTKSLASFIPSRSAPESNASQPKIRALQNWFNGSSAPVKVGVASPAEYSESESGSESGEDYDSEEESEEEEEGSSNIMATLLNRGTSLTGVRGESPQRAAETPTHTPTKSQQPATGSKFAWLLSAQKNAEKPSAPSPVYHNPDDELLNVNIAQALFPHGPADPFAPSSFNDLLANAEALLSRYQKSYRQLSTALVDARSEQSAQEDELDEADTRVRHLKMQLETMAARATEQDEQMHKMMEDLAFERRARQEEEEAARKRSPALVRSQPACEHTECVDTTPRRRNRISNSEISVDSGFESDCETDGTSVFSKTCMSPTDTDISSVLERDLDSTPKTRKPQPVERNSTHDKVRNGTLDLDNSAWGCANCQGGAQASVWGRLAKEREENRTLRHRVDQLEHAVEGALDVVHGSWGM